MPFASRILNVVLTEFKIRWRCGSERMYGNHGRIGQIFRWPADFPIVPGLSKEARIVVIRLCRRTEYRSIVFFQGFRGRARGNRVFRYRRSASEFPFGISCSRRSQICNVKSVISCVKKEKKKFHDIMGWPHWVSGTYDIIIYAIAQ